MCSLAGHAPTRQVLVDVGVQRDEAFLHKLQRRERGHGLGDRCGLEQRLRGDGPPGFDVGEAVAARPSDLAVNEHGNADTGHAEFLHPVGERSAARWLAADHEGREQRRFNLCGGRVDRDLAAGGQRGEGKGEETVMDLDGRSGLMLRRWPCDARPAGTKVRQRVRISSKAKRTIQGRPHPVSIA